MSKMRGLSLAVNLAFCDVSNMDNPDTSFAKQLQDSGVARGGYAYDIANGRRVPNQRLALRIYRATGRKIGPIADLSDETIAVLEQVSL
jgi:hypothetical protein